MPNECSNCKYYMDGQCRKAAPIAIISVSSGDLRLWPLTEADDWCGDFSAIPRSSTENCLGCKYVREGGCHRLAPTLLGAVGAHQALSWPAIRSSYWCGEYVASTLPALPLMGWLSKQAQQYDFRIMPLSAAQQPFSAFGPSTST